MNRDHRQRELNLQPFFNLFSFRLRCGKIICYSHFLTFEKADIISQCNHGFLCKMTSEEQSKK